MNNCNQFLKYVFFFVVYAICTDIYEKKCNMFKQSSILYVQTRACV